MAYKNKLTNYNIHVTWKNKYGEKHKHWIMVYIVLAFGGVHSSQILLHVHIGIDIC